MGANVFFVLMGAIMVLAMHAGFAFLEVGTVRRKNQVNALVKIIADFAVSTIAYFFVGYAVAYGIDFLAPADVISGANGSAFAKSGFDLVKFFFLLTFAAAIPAIISGGIAERAQFYPQLMATAILTGLVYPFFEGIAWNGNFGLQAWMEASFSTKFHDFAGSIVVHAVGGWLALGAVVMLGARLGRYGRGGTSSAFSPSNIPFLAPGSWVLCVGWFGFNVMSAQSLQAMTGPVAMNSLMAMVGGILCALATGSIAGAVFVRGFNFTQEKLKIDDVLGVWPLHGISGLWGGIACGIFGLKSLGGLGGVSFVSQLLGSLLGVAFATACGFLVYGGLAKTIGIRLSQEEEYCGADIAIHRITAYPEDDLVQMNH